MARIAKFHLASCQGGDCECLWELDYRPQGLYGPRRRVRFQTKKAAERFLAQTALQAARGEYVEPAAVPTFAEVSVNPQRDRRIGVTEVMLQVGNRNPALDQDRRATVTQAVERDRSQLRPPQGWIEALPQ